jgi:hypothetical protein
MRASGSRQLTGNQSLKIRQLNAGHQVAEAEQSQSQTRSFFVTFRPSGVSVVVVTVRHFAGVFSFGPTVTPFGPTSTGPTVTWASLILSDLAGLLTKNGVAATRTAAAATASVDFIIESSFLK